MPGITLPTTFGVADEAASSGGAVSEPVAFRSVLVGVDGTPTGSDAIALADLLCDPDGHLTLAHVTLTTTPGYRNFHATSGPAVGGSSAGCSSVTTRAAR